MTHEIDAARESYRGVFDSTLGFGSAPLLLIVDFVRAYTTPGAALYAPSVVDAVASTVPLAVRARAANVPVVYTRVEYSAHAMEGGLFVKKVPVLRELVAGAPLGEIVPELTPGLRDTVLVKHYASAFFGTSLASMLTALRVDTILLTGCSTSGCIRATAVDGLQHGFRVIVPRECVADRAAGPHEANLFDIQSKCGDVVSRREVLDYLERIAQIR